MLESLLDKAQREAISSKVVHAQSYSMWKKSIKGGVELAWKKEFAERPSHCYERKINHHMEVERAQREGRPPP